MVVVVVVLVVMVVVVVVVLVVAVVVLVVVVAGPGVWTAASVRTDRKVVRSAELSPRIINPL